jgi:hypothetical protein
LKALGLGAAALLLAGMVALAPAAQADDTLPPGEYSCIGSGGSVLIGLGFKLGDDGTYTDLDNTTSGTYAVSGNEVTFTGGHLDGYTGRDIANHGFNIGAMASCQLWSG